MQGLDLAKLSDKTLDNFRKAIPPFIEVGNPYDIWPSVTRIGTDAAFKVAVESLFDDENVDAIIAGFQGTEGYELKDLDFISAASRNHPEKTIIAYATSEWSIVEKLRERLEKLGIPVYYSPEDAVEVLSVMHRYSRIRASK
jgi:acyl-CoA synthetase (NDP forming)